LRNEFRAPVHHAEPLSLHRVADDVDTAIFLGQNVPKQAHPARSISTTSFPMIYLS
jgi:hypothetical protein